MSKRKALTADGLLHYAIRDVSTGLYVNGQSGYHLTEQNVPHLVGREDTARSHRRRAMREKELPGPFVIQKVVVRYEFGDDMVDPIVMDRVKAICRIPADCSSQRSELMEIARRVEDVLRATDEAHDMRYLMIVHHVDDDRIPDITEMVRCHHFERGFFLHSMSDVLVLRLMEGVMIDFIYDFETQQVLPQRNP